MEGKFKIDMKRVSILLFIMWVDAIALLPGCSKDSSAQPVEPDVLNPSIKFTANGQNYSWPSESPGISKANDSSYVITTAPPMSIVDSAFFIVINADSLIEGTYSSTNTSVVEPGYAPAYWIFNNSLYQASETGDYATVTVTKVHNGLLHGTFLALMTTDDSTKSRINITNGVFTNLKIR
jgi:hypothetical protein